MEWQYIIIALTSILAFIVLTRKNRMQLSPHFTLLEATKSQTALRLGIDNSPNEDQVNNAELVCENILEPLRAEFGPFSPQSFIRVMALNRAVGGSTRSDHLRGKAADIEIRGVDNYDLAIWIRENLTYKQLILEYYTDGEPSSGWVHVSYDPKDNRMQCLTRTPERYQQGIIK